MPRRAPSWTSAVRRWRLHRSSPRAGHAFGVTFVLAPEHPDVFRLNDSPEVHEYVNRALNEWAEAEERERRAQGEKTASRPLRAQSLTGEQIPMFVADYVLLEYGTGA